MVSVALAKYSFLYYNTKIAGSRPAFLLGAFPTLAFTEMWFHNGEVDGVLLEASHGEPEDDGGRNSEIQNAKDKLVGWQGADGISKHQGDWGREWEI